MFDILANIYILPLYAVIVGCIILWFYDKFENKQYKLSQYVRISLLVYISAFCLIYIMHHSWFTSLTSNTISTTQFGGNNGSISNTAQNFKPINMEFDNGMPILGGGMEHFNTGLPTF